jgi:DNA polymerase-3 subunit delta'
MALPALERHPHARAVLGAAVPPQGAPSHAYLFHGPAGAGKASAARAFAAELLAEGAADPDAVRARVERGTHPDLTWVVPTGAAVMRREDIEEPVVGAVSRTPFEARRRVFVIERADVMNDQAANRLLKTLEEPPPYAHLVLLTERPGEVLPTIASRCQPVRFDAPTADELEQRLAARVAPESARACARLALGDGDRALALALGEGPALRAAAETYARAALRDELTGQPWLALVERAKALGAAAQAEVEERVRAEAEPLPDRERKRAEREGAETAKRAARRARTRALDEALRLAGLWLRDVACVADGAEDVVFATDRLDALREDAAGRSPHRLREGVALTDETRAALTLNVTEELALEALAYRLAALLS